MTKQRRIPDGRGEVLYVDARIGSASQIFQAPNGPGDHRVAFGMAKGYPSKNHEKSRGEVTV
ncbi:hypothetical protein D3C80_2089450 [compost metagenome]